MPRLWEDQLFDDDVRVARAEQAEALAEQLRAARELRGEAFKDVPLFVIDPDAPWDGERIKRARLALGETYREFGARVGVNKSTIFYWELNKGKPRHPSIVQRLNQIEREAVAA